MNLVSTLYIMNSAYVGNSAAGFGNSVRTAIMGRLERGKWRLANYLDFFVSFLSRKKKNRNQYKSVDFLIYE